VRIRRLLVPLAVLAGSTLAACGGGDDDSSGEKPNDAKASTSSSATGTSSPAPDGLPTLACDLVSADDVAEAVGSPVKAGTPLSGPAVTGGEFSTCAFLSDDPENPADTATITLYPNRDAADQGRGADAEPIEGLGDEAWAAAFGSVWVHVGDISLFTQWYTFDGTDEENLSSSTALAEAAVDALS